MLIGHKSTFCSTPTEGKAYNYIMRIPTLIRNRIALTVRLKSTVGALQNNRSLSVVIIVLYGAIELVCVSKCDLRIQVELTGGQQGLLTYMQTKH